MAIGIENLDNVDAPDSDYPYGKVRDNTGSGNGTPANTKTLGDFHQFFARLLDKAGLTANGLPDNELSGFQYFEALQDMLGNKGIKYPDDLNDFIEAGIFNITQQTPTNAPFLIGNVDSENPALLFVGKFAGSSTAGIQTIITNRGWAYRSFNVNTLVFGAWTGTFIKRISMGAWNMDTTASISVAHGLDSRKILRAWALIEDDTNSGGGFPNPLVRMLNCYSGQNIQGGCDWDATNIIVERLTGGVFDNTSYDATTTAFGARNRGTIYVEYAV